MNKSESPNTNCLAGLRCPECGSYGPFWINVTIHAEVLMCDDGTEDTKTQNTDWDDESDFRCSECRHTGTGKDFQEPAEENHSSGSYSDIARDGRFE